ncbi:uncharacterized protein LOC144147113 isoform X2 [Haemaphysalis longicornis]
MRRIRRPSVGHAMADQATQTPCSEAQQRVGSPTHLAKGASSPFFEEGPMQGGQQGQQPANKEELAKMMAKMMSCPPMDMGPDGGTVLPDALDAKKVMADLLAKSEEPRLGADGEPEADDETAAIEHLETVVAGCRDLLYQLQDALHAAIAEAGPPEDEKGDAA